MFGSVQKTFLNKHSLFFATPEKAILDLLYLYPQYNNEEEIKELRFDEVFMQLDMMECDGAIKKQAKVNLNSIYYFIQGAIAAANNCANEKAEKLYEQASKMLDNMIANNCGCTGINYVINYQY
jgi:hypothetical protein